MRIKIRANDSRLTLVALIRLIAANSRTSKSNAAQHGQI